MKYFAKQLKYILVILFVFLLTACSITKSCINEHNTTYGKFPITVEWIETKEEYEAARYKSNGKLEVSVLRESKSITNEKGAVLANIYYDKPVVSGDSEAAGKINHFIDELAANINADNLKWIIKDALPEDEMYDEIGGNNYVIHYYDDELAMNYEYFYNGENFYIILNRNKKSEDGLIIEWNGKWGDDYEAESFQYWEQQGSEMWQKEK